MQYLYKYWVCRVEILQDWSATRTIHCGSCYDVTIATYSLADLYLPAMENALFVTPEFNGLSFVRAVWWPYLPTPTEWATRANNTSWRRKTLILPFEWRGPGTHCVATNWLKCYNGHIMELCDNCNNRTKFQFHAEKVFRNNPFFVTLNNFMSTMWRHKSTNLHKSKSYIPRQPRVLSQLKKRPFSPFWKLFRIIY